jgi:flagellar hook protein FlgE
MIAGGTLEQSNVEISDQFIDLIAYQKAYQANAKTISTADGLMQEVFQLLR